jgi:hypothetical protein
MGIPISESHVEIKGFSKMVDKMRKLEREEYDIREETNFD